MLFRSLLLFSLLTAFVRPCLAASERRWLADKDDVINMKIGYLLPSLIMSTRTGGNSGDNGVEYNPTPLSKTAFGASYRNLGATLSFSNPQNSSDVEKYGGGSALDLQVSFFGERLTQQYFYQTYDGYYIHNTTTVDPTYPADQYIKRPDIRTQHYGVNFIYNFQPENYSLGIAFDQRGRQLTNGGAWLVSGGLHNHRFSSNPQLLPTQIASKYGELATLEQGDIMQVNIAGGGGYTWVYRENYYVTVQALFGFGFAYQKFETAENYYKRKSFNQTGGATLSFGYNGKNNYFVLQGGTDSFTYDMPDMKWQITSQYSAFIYGHRFAEMDVPILNSVSAWLD